MDPTAISLRHTKSRPSCKAHPTLEALETRIVPYAPSGDAWPHANLVTISFEPDGTNLGGVSSNLFASFNAKWATSTWQNQILRAAQVWAQQANLNFTVVADSGVPTGSGSYEQGDPTIGDIRIGGYNFGSSTLAAAYLPPQGNNYSIAGDIAFNTGQAFNIGATYDLFTVACHEFGHTLGLLHSSQANAIMYSSYTTQKSSLTSDDINGIQALYGAPPAASGNNSFCSAASLNGYISSSSLTALVTGLDISTTTEPDYYTFTAPKGTSNTLTLNVQSSGLSLLAPAVTVYAADQSTVLGSATGSGTLGSTLSVTINGVTKGQVFYVKVAGANTTAFGTGAYALTLNFGTGASPTVPLPNTQTAAGSTASTQGTSANGAFVPNNILTNTLFTVVGGVTAGFTADTATRFWVDDDVHSDQYPVAVAAARPAAPALVQAPAAIPAGTLVFIAPQALVGVHLPQITLSAAGVPATAPPAPVTGAPIQRVNSPAIASTIREARTMAVVESGSEDVSPSTTVDQQVPVVPPPQSPADEAAPAFTPTVIVPDGSDMGIPKAPDSRDRAWLASDNLQPVPRADAMERGIAGPEGEDAGAAWFATVGAAAAFGGPWSFWQNNQRWRKRLAHGKRVTDERRRMTRYPCWLSSYCWPLGSSWIERCQSMTEDISTGGLKLVLRQPFEEGTVLIMELLGAATERGRRVVARVMHVCEPAPGVWELGCVFEHEATESDVQHLILGGLERGNSVKA